MAESIETLVMKLKSMTVAALRQRYGELFGEPTNSFSKPHLIKRIVWRTQALREGDLSERARKRAGELANDADLRLRAPVSLPASPLGEVVVSPFRVLDPRRPMPGAVLRREYKGRLVEVRVLPKTRVPDRVPTGLSDEFARDPIAQRRWPEFLSRLQIKDAPEDLGKVVKTIWTRVELAMIKANALTLGR
jgi:hypothetical protein